MRSTRDANYDDGLEWWEMPPPSPEYLERQRIRLEKFRAEQRVYYLRDNMRKEARKKLPELIARDGNHCQHCGTTEHITVDHIIPLARGGTNDLENLQLLCKFCNGRKGNR